MSLLDQYLGELGRLHNSTELVEHNLAYVVKLAKQYYYPGVDLLELIQAGNLGLLLASKKYKPELGFKFISYAEWYIRSEIIQSLKRWQPQVFKYIPEIQELVSPESHLLWTQQLEKFHTELDKFRKNLVDCDQYILSARLLAEEQESLQSIGDKFMLSKQRVKQREQVLISKLGEKLNA